MSEPFGWVFQHEETGHMSFCPNDGINTPELFAHINSRFTLCGPAYTRPAPSEAEVEAAARRAAGASWLVDGPNLDRSWDMAPEAVREHFRRVARAALGVEP